MVLKNILLNFVRHAHCKRATICRATECDKPNICKFMNDVFFKTEPTSIICGVADKSVISDELLELVTDGVEENMSFIAKYERKPSTLAGVAINACIPTCYDPEYWEPILERICCDRERELLLLWRTLSSMPKDAACLYGSEDNIIELEYLSVHPLFQRQGIARAMVCASMKETCRQGYRYLRMDCTSAFSASLGESLGFRSVDDVYYKELRDSRGRRFRNIEVPHIKAEILVADVSNQILDE